MNSVLGIDVQARFFTACLVSPAGDVSWWRFTSEAKRQIDAVRECAEYLTRHMQMTVDGVCWIEEPMGRFRLVISTQNRMIGALMGALPKRWTVELIGPTEWRKRVGLGGHATKLQVIALAERLSGASDLDEHQADAYMIARAARLG